MEVKYRFDDPQHIHLLDGQPLFGTSTVIKEIMPPFLAKWGATCAVDHIKLGINKDGMLDKFERLEEAVLAWSKVRQTAADKGTDAHEELEKYVKACIENGAPMQIPGKDAVAKFSEWAVKNVEIFIASEVHTYHKELWVGGIVDGVVKLKTGQLAVLDFKASGTYFNQFVQCAGYSLQLEESGYGNADGSNWRPVEGKIEALVVFPYERGKPEIITNVEGFKDAFRHMALVYPMLLAFNRRNK